MSGHNTAGKHSVGWVNTLLEVLAGLAHGSA